MADKIVILDPEEGQPPSEEELRLWDDEDGVVQAPPLVVRTGARKPAEQVVEFTPEEAEADDSPLMPYEAVPELDSDEIEADLLDFPPPEWVQEGIEAAEAPDDPYQLLPEVSPAEGPQALEALAGFGQDVAGAVAAPIVAGAQALPQAMVPQPLDPKQVAFEQQEEADRQAHDYAQRAHQALLDQATQAQRNVEMYQNAMLEANRRSQRLAMRAEEIAQTEVDPNRWWRNASTLQGIGAGIQMVLGGYFAAMHGGANQGIAHVQRLIDQDIEAQVEDLHTQRFALNEQRGLLAEEYNRQGDIYEARETMRLGALKRIQQEIAADMVLYEPDSSSFQRRRSLLLSLQQAEMAASQKANQRWLDNYLKLSQDQLAWEKFNAEQAKAAGAGASGPGLKAPLGKLGVYGFVDLETGQAVEAKSKDASDRLDTLNIFASQATRYYQELVRLREQADKDWPGEPDNRFWKTNLGMALREKEGNLLRLLSSKEWANTGAAMTEPEFKRKIEPVMGRATSWLSFDTTWKEAMADLHQDVETTGTILAQRPVRWNITKPTASSYEPRDVEMPTPANAIDRVTTQQQDQLKQLEKAGGATPPSGGKPKPKQNEKPGAGLTAPGSQVSSDAEREYLRRYPNASQEEFERWRASQEQIEKPSKKDFQKQYQEYLKDERKTKKRSKGKKKERIKKPKPLRTADIVITEPE